MPPNRLLLLVAVVSVVLVVAVGASYPSVDGVRCPERVWSAALDGLADQAPEPCAAQSMHRVYTVAAALMGMVIISGLLSRRS